MPILKSAAGLIILFTTLASLAAIKTETVIYKDGDTELEGFIAYDTSITNPKPAVIIIHDWMGPSEYTQMRAQQLAELGYVAFAADIYGKDLRPKNQEEAAKIAGQFRDGDRKVLRARAKAAYDYISRHKEVAKGNVSSMGYCFGGTVALEMARAGLPLKGVVSFHGGLSTPNPKDAKKIKSKLLILHGAIDPFVPTEEIQGFLKEMNDAKVDYQFIMYSGAVHSFTQKKAGKDLSKGQAYNAAADKRSFEAMKTFLSSL